MAEIRRTEKECERTSRLQDFANVNIPTETGAVCDSDEKDVGKADILGGSHDMMLISESGLYTLIMRSDKPEAKVFRKLVSDKNVRDASVLDLGADSVIKDSLITAVDCGISQSTFSP